MQSKQPTGRLPYLNQRDQWRMLAMVGLLMLIVLAIRVASKPSSWYWLTGAPQEAPAGADRADEIDFDVRLKPDRPLRPDEFFVVTPDDDPQNTAPSADESAAGGEFEFAPETFADVEDNTLGVQRDEAEAHNLLLARARDMSPEKLADAARDDVAFTVLMLESDQFRGVPLTVNGIVKRVSELPSGRNAYNIDRLYEAWIFTRDSGVNPYRFVFTTPPEGIPIGSDIEEEIAVKATGFFFKRYGYATPDGMHVAPMLLGRSLQRVFSQESIPLDTGFANYVIGGVLAGLVILVFVLWRLNRGDRKFYDQRLKQFTSSSDGSVAELQGQADESAREMFGRMQEDEIAHDTTAGSSDHNARQTEN